EDRQADLRRQLAELHGRRGDGRGRAEADRREPGRRRRRVSTMPPDDVRIPDVVGNIEAWRAWKLVGNPRVPRLMSVTAAAYGVDTVNAIWPTRRWYEAHCPHGHTVTIPDESCTCGIYAARDREQLIELNYGAY